MTDSADRPEVPPTPAVERPAPATRLASRGFVAAAFALLAAALLAVWLDARRDIAEVREEAARRLADAESALAQSRERGNRLDGEVREAQAKLKLLETRVAESQSQQASLEALYREMAPSRDDLALTEVEQILLIANQQLALAGNVPAALAALQLADGKLARIDRPQVAPLRRALARDVERLRAVPFIDVDGDHAEARRRHRAGRHAAAREGRTAPAAGARSRQARTPGLAQGDRRRVGGATLAGAAGDQRAPDGAAGHARSNRTSCARTFACGCSRPAWRSSDARRRATRRTCGPRCAWTRQYFDMRTRQGQALQETLAQMLATPVPDDLPDLGASLDAVRALKAAQERSLPTPPTPARANR